MGSPLWERKSKLLFDFYTLHFPFVCLIVRSLVVIKEPVFNFRKQIGNIMEINESFFVKEQLQISL